MAFPNASHLSADQLEATLVRFGVDGQIRVVRIRPHNGREIRKVVTMRLSELRALVMGAIGEGHLAGGDLEVVVPGVDKRLVGHHDGVFWLEPVEATPNTSLERTREK